MSLSKEQAIVEAAMKPLRIFEATIPISAPVPGYFNDWPDNIKEGILKAKEGLEQTKNLNLRFHHSVCEDDEEGWYLRVALIEDREKGVRLANGTTVRWEDV